MPVHLKTPKTVSNTEQDAEKENKLPLSVNVIPQLGILHNVYFGRVTIQDFEDQKKQRSKTSAFKMPMPRVNDLSQVTEVDIGFNELLVHAQETGKALSKISEPIQLVMVGDNPFTSTAVAMYENLYAACNIPFEMHVVRGYPEVLATLNLPEDSLKYFPDFCRDESHLL